MSASTQSGARRHGLVIRPAYSVIHVFPQAVMTPGGDNQRCKTSLH